MTRLLDFAILSATTLLLCASAPASDATPTSIAEAARTIMAADPTPTLVSLDDTGRPRARTVQASTPDDAFVVWLATRPNTRKVGQIRADARVTLHYADDSTGRYVSLMGTATLHDDPDTIAAHTFHDESDLAAFWPDYPDDYLLIRIEPEWIEALGPGAPADEVTWRPARLDP